MEIASSFIVLVPIIVGVVQVAKVSGMNSRYAPLLSLALGVGFGVGMGQVNFAGIMQGVAIGLSASGLYSGGKAMISKDEYL